MPDFQFAPCSAFAGLAVPTAGPGEVFATDRDGLGLATVQVRRGQTDALARRVKELFGIELPRGARRVAAGEVAFAGTGPGTWLASCERGGNRFAAALQRALADVASVCDQSDGYAVLRLGGPKARETLLKLVSIDLHASAFKPGDLAPTLAAHMAITLWRLEDAPEGSPVFELTVFRSLASSFWHVLSASASEYGLVVRAPDPGSEQRDRQDEEGSSWKASTALS
jgi:sarcosine oxidase subunit gamma